MGMIMLTLPTISSMEVTEVASPQNVSEGFVDGCEIQFESKNQREMDLWKRKKS